MNPNAYLHEQTKIVTMLASSAGGSGEVPVSLKGYERLAIVITALNVTTVTGSAITLKQSTVIALTDEKVLAFTKMWANIDTAATDTLVETAVTSDTFTTDATNAKKLEYVLEVKASDLDIANGFDVVRIDTTAATASTLSIVCILYGTKDMKATPLSAIVD